MENTNENTLDSIIEGAATNIYYTPQSLAPACAAIKTAVAGLELTADRTVWLSIDVETGDLCASTSCMIGNLFVATTRWVTVTAGHVDDLAVKVIAAARKADKWRTK